MALYLVTGGAGFIGSSIAETLLAKGERVRILDDFSTGRRSNIESLKGDVEVIEGSIGGDDRALPGLGVLFEIIWQNIDEDTQQKLVHVLHEQVKPA